MKIVTILKHYLERKRLRNDREYKDAVHYGFQHFSGEELDRFLRILDDLYICGKRKDMK